MKVVFLSNYFNHHQQYFSEAMYRLIGEDYTFIETSQMREERKALGYGIDDLPSYVKQAHGNQTDLTECMNLIGSADVVIIGSAPEKLLKYRKKQNGLIFRYHERVFKQELALKQKIKRIVASLIYNFGRKNIHLLCASAYTAGDYKKMGLFINKAYKWGYFPSFKEYNVESLIAHKEKNKILWCGRFLPFKHPEYALQAAKKLKREGYDFLLEFIGTGLLEEKLKRQTEEMGLQKEVNFLGTMKPEQVREHMEKASIFMFTSNGEEGWGVVLNEAMNSGCAVLASSAIGSVPYLLENNVNGFVFENENEDDLYIKFKHLLDNPEKQKEFGENAYKTVAELWNPNVAAERFIELVRAIQKSDKCEQFCDGPCSKAQILTNNWFGEHNNESFN